MVLAHQATGKATQTNDGKMCSFLPANKVSMESTASSRDEVPAMVGFKKKKRKRIEVFGVQAISLLERGDG